MLELLGVATQLKQNNLLASREREQLKNMHGVQRRALRLALVVNPCLARTVLGDLDPSWNLVARTPPQQPQA